MRIFILFLVLYVFSYASSTENDSVFLVESSGDVKQVPNTIDSTASVEEEIIAEELRVTAELISLNNKKLELLRQMKSQGEGLSPFPPPSESTLPSRLPDKFVPLSTEKHRSPVGISERDSFGAFFKLKSSLLVSFTEPSSELSTASADTAKIVATFIVPVKRRSRFDRSSPCNETVSVPIVAPSFFFVVFSADGVVRFMVGEQQLNVSIFVSLDPFTDILAGRSWSHQQYRQLYRSSGILFEKETLEGESGVYSEPQTAMGERQKDLHYNYLEDSNFEYFSHQRARRTTGHRERIRKVEHLSSGSETHFYVLTSFDRLLVFELRSCINGEPLAGPFQRCSRISRKSAISPENIHESCYDCSLSCPNGANAPLSLTLVQTNRGIGQYPLQLAGFSGGITSIMPFKSKDFQGLDGVVLGTRLGFTFVVERTGLMRKENPTLFWPRNTAPVSAIARKGNIIALAQGCIVRLSYIHPTSLGFSILQLPESECLQAEASIIATEYESNEMSISSGEHTGKPSSNRQVDIITGIAFDRAAQNTLWVVTRANNVYVFQYRTVHSRSVKKPPQENEDSDVLYSRLYQHRGGSVDLVRSLISDQTSISPFQELECNSKVSSLFQDATNPKGSFPFALLESLEGKQNSFKSGDIFDASWTLQGVPNTRKSQGNAVHSHERVVGKDEVLPLDVPSTNPLLINQLVSSPSGYTFLYIQSRRRLVVMRFNASNPLLFGSFDLSSSMDFQKTEILSEKGSFDEKVLENIDVEPVFVMALFPDDPNEFNYRCLDSDPPRQLLSFASTFSTNIPSSVSFLKLLVFQVNLPSACAHAHAEMEFSGWARAPLFVVGIAAFLVFLVRRKSSVSGESDFHSSSGSSSILGNPSGDGINQFLRSSTRSGRKKGTGKDSISSRFNYLNSDETDPIYPSTALQQAMREERAENEEYLAHLIGQKEIFSRRDKKNASSVKKSRGYYDSDDSEESESEDAFNFAPETATRFRNLYSVECPIDEDPGKFYSRLLQEQMEKFNELSESNQRNQPIQLSLAPSAGQSSRLTVESVGAAGNEAEIANSYLPPNRSTIAKSAGRSTTPTTEINPMNDKLSVKKAVEIPHPSVQPNMPHLEEIPSPKLPLKTEPINSNLSNSIEIEQPFGLETIKRQSDISNVGIDSRGGKGEEVEEISSGVSETLSSRESAPADMGALKASIGDLFDKFLSENIDLLSSSEAFTKKWNQYLADFERSHDLSSLVGYSPGLNADAGGESESNSGSYFEVVKNDVDLHNSQNIPLKEAIKSPMHASRDTFPSLSHDSLPRSPFESTKEVENFVSPGKSSQVSDLTNADMEQSMYRHLRGIFGTSGSSKPLLRGTSPGDSSVTDVRRNIGNSLQNAPSNLNHQDSNWRNGIMDRDFEENLRSFQEEFLVDEDSADENEGVETDSLDEVSHDSKGLLAFSNQISSYTRPFSRNIRKEVDISGSLSRQMGVQGGYSLSPGGGHVSAANHPISTDNWGNTAEPFSSDDDF